MLAATRGAERMFFWLAAETGMRAGELIALRATDVDVVNLSVDVSKAIWGGEEDSPKTEAGLRSICLSTRLGAALKEYLAGRIDGYLFQSPSGKAWDSSNVLERKLNGLLERREIPKLDRKLLAKFVGKDRSIEEATLSERHVASLGLHSFRHTNATAMDSLGVPQ
jgi:integrase